MKSHEIKMSCPYCNAKQDRASNVPDEDTAPPKAGDVSFCLDCGRISFFCHDASLRKPTRQEQIELSRDAKTLKLIFAWAMSRAFGHPPPE